ncbi:hypothetical protein ACWDUN_23615 [Mycobacterium sp. NPDC003323]
MPRGKGVYVDDPDEPDKESAGKRAAERADRGDATPDVYEPEPGNEPPD